MKAPASRHDLAGLSWPGDSSGGIGRNFALAAFWFVATSAIVIVSGLLVWETHTRELARAERELANLGRILAEQTARAVDGVDMVLRGTEERLRAGRASGTLMDGLSIHNLLHARIAGLPQVRVLSVIDADGYQRHTSAEFPAPTVALADREYFALLRARPEERSLLGQPVRNRVDGAWMLPMSRRLGTTNGDFAGVVVAGIAPAYFEELYASISLSEGSEVSLCLRDGRLLAGHPHRESAIGKRFDDFPNLGDFDAQAGAAPRPTVLRAAGEIVVYGEIKGYPLVVKVAESESAALADWRQEATMLGTGAAMMVALLTLGTLALGRKLAQEEALAAALGDSRSRLQGIISSAMDAIVTVDEQHLVVLFNPAAEKMFGCTEAEALGKPLERFIPERYRTEHREHMRRFAATGVSSRAMGGQLHIVGCRANGEEFPADISISQVSGSGHKLYTAIVRDITSRHRAEEELRQSHQRLRELTGFLESVREEERTRIARELHDELGQQLTALKMDLAWMESRLGEKAGELGAKIGGMKRLIDATAVSTRRIAAELRPAVLDDLGLPAAMEWLGRDFSARSGVAVTMDLGAEDWTPEPELATALFRIVQESLTNVARHAEASRVDISLTRGGGQLRLEVADDGRGMAPEAADKKGHFGLLGIRERLRPFAGQMRIASQPGAGTALTITIPLPEGSHGEQAP